MNYKNKSIPEKKIRTKGIAIIIILGSIGCLAACLAVVNILKCHFIFAAAYFIACILSIIYTVIKINTVFPLYIGNDESFIYMRYWQNRFFPFKTDKGFFGEFIPEKTNTKKISIPEISAIYVGSGNFITRNLPESEFAKTFKTYKTKFSSSLRHMEFIHITYEKEKEEYMPVTDFDTMSLAEIIKNVQKQNKNLKFTTGNRKLRNRVPENEIKFDY